MCSARARERERMYMKKIYTTLNKKDK